MRRGPTDSREGGFTLVEVLVSTLVFAVLILGVGKAILSTVGAAGNLERRHTVFTQAQTFMDTLMEMRFGRPGEAAATTAEVVEVFDSDTFRGTVSLLQLRELGPVGFELTGFPVPGPWEIVVSDDLNGDGDTTDENEGRDDLFRVEVRHDGNRILATERAGPTPLEDPGEANPLYGTPPPGDDSPPEEDDIAGAAAVVDHLGFTALRLAFDDAIGPADPGSPDGGAK